MISNLERAPWAMKAILLFVSGSSEKDNRWTKPKQKRVMYHLPFQQNWLLRDGVEFEHFGLGRIRILRANYDSIVRFATG